MNVTKQSSRTWITEPEHILPTATESMAKRTLNSRAGTPLSPEKYLPKTTEKISLIELIGKTDEELRSIGLSYEQLGEMVNSGNEEVKIEVLNKIESPDEGLQIYAHYVDEFIRRATSRGDGTIKVTDMVLLARGTLDMLINLKECMGDEIYTQTQDDILLTSELIQLSFLDCGHVKFSDSMKCNVMTQTVDYISRDPKNRLDLLSFVRARVGRSPDLSNTYREREKGIRAEVVAMDIISQLKVLDEQSMFVFKTTAQKDSKGVDLIIGSELEGQLAGKPLFSPKISVDVTIEPATGMDVVFVIMPETTSPTGYRALRSGIKENSLAYVYEVNEDTVAESVKQGVPFLIIRVPGGLADPEQIESVEGARHYDMLYNDFALRLEGEIRYIVENIHYRNEGSKSPERKLSV